MADAVGSHPRHTGAIKDAPIEDAKRSIIAINRKRMQELGIKLSPETQGIVDKWIN